MRVRDFSSSFTNFPCPNEKSYNPTKHARATLHSPTHPPLSSSLVTSPRPLSTPTHQHLHLARPIRHRHIHDRPQHLQGQGVHGAGRAPGVARARDGQAAGGRGSQGGAVQGSQEVRQGGRGGGGGADAATDDDDAVAPAPALATTLTTPAQRRQGQFQAGQGPVGPPQAFVAVGGRC